MKKKLIGMLSGFLAFVVIVMLFKVYIDSEISSNAEGLRNHRTYERYWSSEVQKRIIDENTLVLFGSSELVPVTDYENGIGSFLNGEEMNLLTIGGGNFQSLSHAMSLGAISGYLKNNKIALFLSPQWFTPSGIDATAFAARFSEDNLLGLLKNQKVSKANKDYILNRTVSLLQGSPTQLSRVIKYQNAYKNKFSIDFLYTELMTEFWKYRCEFQVFKQLNSVDSSIPTYNLSEISFDDMLKLAEAQGNIACTNNEFGIYDEYFDTYVKETYKAGEVTEKKQVFEESVEYDDLKCFLSIADELGLEVILVSIPVNAKWYSYIGQSCDNYYKNIRDIAKEYSNINFVDMSGYENEKYFLKDIMHLGWKGWTRINERLFKAFTQE